MKHTNRTSGWYLGGGTRRGASISTIAQILEALASISIIMISTTIIIPFNYIVVVPNPSVDLHVYSFNP
jgi:hypothetical protein